MGAFHVFSLFGTCYNRYRIERGRHDEEGTQRASDGEALVTVFSQDLRSAARSFLSAASCSENHELWSGRDFQLCGFPAGDAPGEDHGGVDHREYPWRCHFREAGVG